MSNESVGAAFGEDSDGSTIGIVESVSPNTIEVGILREAPHGTGMREGELHRFPRINSYVVLPSEQGSILAIVTWLGIESDRFRGPANGDEIGLPIPRRRLHALPLGVLRRTSSILGGREAESTLDRGVLLFPTVGDPVRLPSRVEAKAAVAGSRSSASSVKIGTAPLAGNADVFLDPNRLFGRHLAVLGNTGSGKSCTVAQLLRSSAATVAGDGSRFRAIVLDMNGEYNSAFDHLGTGITVRRFTANPEDSESNQLRVPYWLWNYREWLSFSEASSRGQAPQLRRTLQMLRSTGVDELPIAVVGLIAGRRIVNRYAAGGIDPKSNSDCLSALDNALVAAGRLRQDCEPDLDDALEELERRLASILDDRRGGNGYLWAFGAHQLNQQECAELMPLFDNAIGLSGVPDFSLDGLWVDAPIPFDADLIVELLPLLAVDSGPEAVGWVAPMIERLRIGMSDQRLRSIAGWDSSEDLAGWLADNFVDGTESQVNVIDMSLVPSHMLQLVAGVFARVLLESLERHRRLSTDEQIPTLLVVEEAHSLIRKASSSTSDEQAVSSSRLCREAFERIAREGRKFGLALVVSSQRPSELSETVLSQCNSFLIHRIVNDHDQRLVKRLVPDSLGTLTDELPALPSQTALAVGWAIDVPTVVRIADLPEHHRPRSEDPDFAGSWRADSAEGAQWAAVATDWAPVAKEEDEASEDDSPEEPN